jgi:TolB protein
MIFKTTKTLTTVKKLMCLVGMVLSTAFIAPPAFAQLQVDITRGNVEPLPIGLPPLAAINDLNTRVGSVAQLGIKISEVVMNDLQRSGLFRAIDKEAFITVPGSDVIRPKFANWRAIGANAMVSGILSLEKDGRLKVEFRLWDVFSERQMTGLRYMAPPENWRRIAHLISDTVYQRLTGEKGYFDTRLVYIAESGPKTARKKQLAMMDQDGANHLFLTNGDDLVLTPRFSPTRQEITYMAYYNNIPRVYLYNIDTGKHEVLGDFEGITFAPRFSPDGNSVVMSLITDGNSDVYLMDLRTRRMKQLTTNPGIDTSPSFSPDGNFITFNSDRGGTPQIYIMKADGSGIQRISFGNGRYLTPVWSPRGDLIAFTRIGGGKIRIGIMRVDGSGERLLTDSYQDEAPTWSPNGRVLMFFRTQAFKNDGSGGGVNLWSVDLTGYNERLVRTPLAGSDPAWSPLLR